jgi:hypothetical protein
MEAGPRNKSQQPDGQRDERQGEEHGEQQSGAEPLTADGPDPLVPSGDAGVPRGLELDGPDGPGQEAGLDASYGPDAAATGDESGTEGGESFRELRPPRRLRLWQLAPIVVLGAAGSLMFAFPLAFEFGSGDGGAVIAMLGLLLCCCAAGWGMMAARRVGHTWPGLHPRGSGRRPDWRVVVIYVAVVLVLAALAIWRVARLR